MEEPDSIAASIHHFYCGVIHDMNEQDDLIQKSILRDMSEGVLIIGLDGRIRYFNPAAVHILEKDEEELSDKKIGDLFFDDEHNDHFSQAIIDAVSDLSRPHYKLVSYYTASAEKTLYVMTSFLMDKERKIALIILLNDMTDIASMKRRYSNKLISLIDSLIEALSVAVDERSHYSGNHTRNMVRLGESFLDWLDRSDHPWKFDSQKRHAFLMSIWLHDVGKMSIPLEIMDKATRLGDRLEQIEVRFRQMHFLDRIAYLEKRIDREEWQRREIIRNEWMEAIRRINSSAFLSEEDHALLWELEKQHYTEEDLTEKPVLTKDELNCLSIRRGTLTDEERAVMQSHVMLTRKILEKIDFPEDYMVVREWASCHHELLNGNGYPEKRAGDEISNEIRLLTILDIYEALTSRDRPYKKSIPPEKALKILESMAEEGSLDRDILELFEQSSAWKVIL